MNVILGLFSTVIVLFLIGSCGLAIIDPYDVDHETRMQHIREHDAEMMRLADASQARQIQLCRESTGVFRASCEGWSQDIMKTNRWSEEDLSRILQEDKICRGY